ncbi:MAG: hypothetical protein ABF242_03130 [Flavobacteriales bacterium]
MFKSYSKVLLLVILSIFISISYFGQIRSPFDNSNYYQDSTLTIEEKIRKVFLKKNRFFVDTTSIIISDIDTLTKSQFYLYLAKKYKPSQQRYATNSNVRLIKTEATEEKLLSEVNALIDSSRYPDQVDFCTKMKNRALSTENSGNIYSISCLITYYSTYTKTTRKEEMYYDTYLHLLGTRRKQQ